jgi:hypothetical protein
MNGVIDGGLHKSRWMLALLLPGRAEPGTL